MDRHEYKRLNEAREARRRSRLLEEAEAKLNWYQQRPRWWHVPSDRFAFFAAVATTALAAFAVWQLSVMRGQLDAMERDQQPYVWLGDKLPHPQFTSYLKDKGAIEWAWNITNFGKGEARNTTVDAFLKIGADGVFKRSPGRTGAGWMGEIPGGRTANGVVSSEAIYSQADFDRLNTGTDFGISVLLEIKYVGLNNAKMEKAVCISKFARGGMGIADPEECKKSKEK